MLYIVGKAVAYPPGRIENSHLASAWGGRAPTLVPQITCRSSSLSKVQIVDLKECTGVNGQSPTDFTTSDLGASALVSACENAGIPVSNVGMVVGETSTPEQTIPGVSHRVAKRLDLKVYSFDLFNGFTSLPQMVQTLLEYKKGQLPEYIACVCSNALTPRVSYAHSSLEGELFADAASAVVFSLVKPSPLQIVGASVGTFAIPPQKDRFQSFIIDTQFLSRGIECEQAVLNRASSIDKKIGVLTTLGTHGSLGLSGTPNLVSALSDISSSGEYVVALGDHAVEVRHA
jgi:hypothetical protein